MAWQIDLTAESHAAIFAEMVEAAADADAVTFYQPNDDAPWQVTVLTHTLPDAAKINAALLVASEIAGTAPPLAEITALPTQDWLAENRKAFPPLDIGKFWIYGSHITASVPAGKIGLKINAGQAFGSGSHATTHGCMVMLEKHGNNNAAKIIDIGCGSGILAMAAARLYPDAVVIAVDNDIKAVDMVVENCTHNDLTARITAGLSDGYDSDLVRDSAPYDIILANILPNPLIEMAHDAALVLAPRGRLILSGLLDSQQDKVIAGHEIHGLSLIDSFSHNGWATLVMAHK